MESTRGRVRHMIGTFLVVGFVMAGIFTQCKKSADEAVTAPSPGPAAAAAPAPDRSGSGGGPGGPGGPAAPSRSVVINGVHLSDQDIEALTLTLQAQFDNPAREPWIVEVKGWDNAYKAMMSGQCVATVLPINNLTKNDKGPSRVTKTLYQHKPMPNQAISVGPRIAPELHAKIAKALLSEDGKRATAKLRATYAGKDFVPASREEYSGLSELLKTSLYYR